VSECVCVIVCVREERERERERDRERESNIELLSDNPCLNFQPHMQKKLMNPTF
jgi:hypothetical protein